MRTASARAAAEVRAKPAVLHRAWRWTGRLALVALVVGLAACSQRAGDLGRQPNDYLTRYVYDPIDRRLMTGGRVEMSKLPLADAEKHMYDVLWRFFSAPYARKWTVFGTDRVSPIDLETGEWTEKTDRYYAWLKRSNFQSSRVRYNAMNADISADVQTVGRAFDAVCAVQNLDKQRETAAGSFPELGEEERADVDLRLKENRTAIGNFALALNYRYQSYTHALKRLLVETPDEAARTVDAGLSELGTRVDEARYGEYCAASGNGAVVLSYTNFR